MKKFNIILLIFISFVCEAQVGSTIPTGTSTEVGVTEGELSVSLTGSASYNIPFTVPPGINGVEPKIGLSYNSNSGNGIAGYGWNISGLSSITRIPSTKYHDNSNDPVDFDALDRFALDGHRLIVKNGTSGVYGANNTVYETEVFSNLKITSYGVHPSGASYGPSYFIVQYPDGSLAHYGNSTDSRSITTWSITYTQNAQGLRINYFYTLLDNNIFISSIKYGNVGTTQTLNEVLFTYENRTNIEQGYIQGQNVENRKIVTNIEIKGNSISLRNYFLEYSTNYSHNQKLVKLYEKNVDNTINYNPTVFDYEGSTENSYFSAKLNESIYVNNYEANEIITGDYDEDGKTDIIVKNSIFDSFKLYKDLQGINNVTGLSNITNVPIITSLGSAIFADNVKALFNSSQLINTSTDVNKFKKGWTVINEYSPPALVPEKSYIIKSFYLDANENVILNDTKTVMNNSTCDYNKGTLVKFLPGDFNGDGITDLIGISDFTNTASWTGGCNLNDFYFIDLNKKITTNFYTNCGTIPFQNSYSTNLETDTQIEVIDFNGDGKSDFLIRNDNVVRVFTLNSSQNSFIQLGINIVINAFSDSILIGDFNGDGKTDFVNPTRNNDSWKFYISNGINFILITKSIGLNYEINPSFNCVYGSNSSVPLANNPLVEPTYSQCTRIVSDYIIKDLNGDGKTDISCIKRKIIGDYGTRTVTPVNTPTGYQDVYINGQWHNVPIGFTTTYVYGEWITHPNTGVTTILLNKFLSPSSNTFDDINFVVTTSDVTNNFSDPKLKFFNVNNLGYNNYELNYIVDNTFCIVNRNFRKQNLLTKITTSNGVLEKISYKPLFKDSDNNNYIYKPSLNVEYYPNLDIGYDLNFMVVSKLEKQSSTTYKQKTFGYYGAVSNMDGLGFLGFRQVTQTKWYSPGDQIFSEIFRMDIALRGKVSKEFLVTGYIPPHSFTWEDDPPTKYKLYYTYNLPSEAILINKVFKLKLNQSQEFDVINNTSSTKAYSLYNAYNQPTSSVETIKNGTTTEKTVNSTITYEHFPTSATYIVGRQTSKLQTSTIYPDQTNQDVNSTEELYSYNQAFLLSQVKTKATNSGVTTNYLTQDNTYDLYGNLTKKKITAVGLPSRETSYEYGIAYGYRFLTKSIDVDGLATEYTYNSSTGNLITEKLPSNDGFPLTTTYTYDVWGKKTNTLNYLGNNQTTDYLRQNEKTLVTTTTIVADGNSVNTELLDDLGRKIKVGTKSLNGDMSYVDYEYDNYDRVIKVSEPHFEADSPLWSQTSYDSYGRINQNITAAGKTTTITYNGLTNVVNDGVKTKETVKNALGNVISLIETPGGTVTYNYFANGNLKNSTIDGITTTIIQDGWGRKKQLSDPAAGVYIYSYNDYGDVLKETTPKGFTDYTYYPTGKLFTKWIKDAETSLNTDIKSTYDYNPTTKLLSTITVLNPFDGNNTFNYSYDDRRRLTGTSEVYTTIQPRTFSKTLSFDDYGKIASETVYATAFNKSSSKTTVNTYANGYLNKIYDGAVTGTPLWEATAQNARGQFLQQTLGNGISITNNYDGYGFPLETNHNLISSNTNILSITNVFDTPNGNLTNRTNNMFTWNEPFEYDAADRLTSYNNSQGQTITQDYFDNGKIESNNLGTYNYTVAANPYMNTSLSALTPAGQTFAARNQTVSYNAFSSPIEVTQVNERASFGYNALQQRSVMYYGNNITDKLNRSLRKYYSADGSIEIKYTKAVGIIPAKVEFITYIGGDAYSAPMVVRRIDDGVYENFYLHRDHQGSILAITNSSGTVIEKRLFDAWGKILKIQNGAGTTLTKLTFFDRGYTGHEHMQGVALINMNGRVYDPQLHRFLQPDNNIQDPFNTQNYNRYGYVMNNPLKYTDESGEFWGFVIGALINAYISTAQSSGEGNPFKWSASTWQSAGFNAASSGASYAATYYANSYIEHYNDKPEIKESTRMDGVIDSVNPVNIVKGVLQGEKGFYDSASNIISGDGNFEDYLTLSDKLLPGSSAARGLVETGYQAFEGDEYSQGALIGQAVIILVTKKAGNISKGSFGIEAQQGGLNLFKSGKISTLKNIGWKNGDYMLNLKNLGSPKLNWKQNSGYLRQAMNEGRPIFDSYRYKNGMQIPTRGFLHAERYLLESRGWKYNPNTGGYYPPF